jgi:hypothetical protein
MLTECWGDSLDQDEPVDDWIWPGILRPGQITLMTALPKTGKTTLLSHLLAHRQSGTPLLDRPVRPGLTAVLTEEGRGLWNPRRRKLGFGRDVCFFFRPYSLRPTHEEFAELIAQLLDLKARRGVDLVVFDTLSRFLPLRCENSTESMQQALAPLTSLAEHGLATLLNHHPSKGRAAPGRAARGSIALPAFADILLELHPFAADVAGDRRRLLLGFSRNDETPPSLAIELNEEGTALTILPEQLDSDFPDCWPELRAVLEDAAEPLTRMRLLERWPEDFQRPTLRTLGNWLKTACKGNQVARSGTGRINDPIQYWLPSKMPTWLADPLWRAIHRIPEPPTTRELLPSRDPPPGAVLNKADPIAPPAEHGEEAAPDAGRPGFIYVSAEEAADPTRVPGTPRENQTGKPARPPDSQAEAAPSAPPQKAPLTGMDAEHAAILRWLASLAEKPAD